MVIPVIPYTELRFVSVNSLVWVVKELAEWIMC